MLRAILSLVFWQKTVCGWVGHDWSPPRPGASPDLMAYCPHCLRCVIAGDTRGTNER